MVENFSFQFDPIYHHFSFDHLIITHYKRFTASHVPRHFCLFFNNYCEFCKMVEDFLLSLTQSTTTFRLVTQESDTLYIRVLYNILFEKTSHILDEINIRKMLLSITIFT